MRGLKPITVRFILVTVLLLFIGCSDTPVNNKQYGEAPAMPKHISGQTIQCDTTDTYITNFTYMMSTNFNLYHVEIIENELVLIAGSPSFTVHRVIYPEVQYCLTSDTHGAYAITLYQGVPILVNND